MNYEIANSVAVPLGLLVMLLVQLAKLISIPKKWIHALVLVLALILTGLFQYQAGWYDIVVSFIGTAATAVGAYELTIKKLKDEP